MTFKINDYVEWSFGGLAVVYSEPYRKYGQDVVTIQPVDTGDRSTGIGYTRTWPVAQLKLADMTRWDYDATTNRYHKRY